MSRKSNDRKANGATTAPNKSEFIRAHAALQPREVVEKAKEAGLHFSIHNVYTIRRNAKQTGKRRAAKRTQVTSTPGPRIAPSPAQAMPETAFMRLVIELGVGRARALVSTVANRLAALVRDL